MTRSLREISDAIFWYEQRSCWRFAYRDPFTHERKFAFCLPDRFLEFGIPLPDPEIVRKPTKLARELCGKLQRAFLYGLRGARPDIFAAEAPSVSGAIAAHFALYDHTPAYRASLQAIFSEFAVAVGDKAMNEIRDVDLKAYEVRLASRGLARTTVRSSSRRSGCS